MCPYPEPKDCITTSAHAEGTIANTDSCRIDRWIIADLLEMQTWILGIMFELSIR